MSTSTRIFCSVAFFVFAAGCFWFAWHSAQPDYVATDSGLGIKGHFFNLPPWLQCILAIAAGFYLIWWAIDVLREKVQ